MPGNIIIRLQILHAILAMFAPTRSTPLGSIKLPFQFQSAAVEKCTVEGEHTSTVLLVWHFVYVEVIEFLNPAQTFPATKDPQ